MRAYSWLFGVGDAFDCFSAFLRTFAGVLECVTSSLPARTSLSATPVRGRFLPIVIVFRDAKGKRGGKEKVERRFASWKVVRRSWRFRA